MPIRVLVLCLGLTAVCWSQEPPSSANKEFLLRVSTLKEYPSRGLIDSCVLVTKTGDYRIETRPLSSTHPDVFEGKLTESDLSKLIEILSEPTFAAIPPPKPRGTIVQSPIDSLAATVFHDKRKQNVHFPKINLRKQREIKPLVSWVGDLAKRNDLKASSAPANDCFATEVAAAMLQGEIPNLPRYLVRLHVLRLSESQAECLLVNPDGTFYLERTKLGSKPKAKAYEATITPEQLTQISKVVNSPEVTRLKTPVIQSGVVPIGFATLSITIPREGGMQTLLFADEASKEANRAVVNSFEDWFREFNKRKLQESLTAITNQCK